MVCRRVTRLVRVLFPNLADPSFDLLLVFITLLFVGISFSQLSRICLPGWTFVHIEGFQRRKLCSSARGFIKLGPVLDFGGRLRQFSLDSLVHFRWEFVFSGC